MFKITALKNYTDLEPELIVKGNNKGAKIKKENIYFVEDKERADKIKKSGLAKVEEIKEEAEVETATVKAKAETAVKKTRKKAK